ncbi:MAG TPA: hypothetical protein VHG10_15860 [Glycomyces sp.]|nr:hypothetical protein [Glycomyces sp.]
MVRRTHEEQVLAALRTGGALSRADLAKRVGFSRTTSPRSRRPSSIEERSSWSTPMPHTGAAAAAPPSDSRFGEGGDDGGLADARGAREEHAQHHRRLPGLTAPAAPRRSEDLTGRCRRVRVPGRVVDEVGCREVTGAGVEEDEVRVAFSQDRASSSLPPRLRRGTTNRTPD